MKIKNIILLSLLLMANVEAYNQQSEEKIVKEAIAEQIELKEGLMNINKENISIILKKLKENLLKLNKMKEELNTQSERIEKVIKED